MKILSVKLVWMVIINLRIYVVNMENNFQKDNA